MKTRLFSALIIALACFSFASCEDDDNPNGSAKSELKSINLTNGELVVAKQNNAFAWNMFGNTLDKCGNSIISPLSVSFAMCMTADGACGDTRNEILNAFGFENFDEADVNGYMQKLSSQLRSLDAKTTVSIANSIWYNNSFDILDDYITSLNTYYDAEVMPLDATNAVEQINDWCSNKTNGYIDDLFEPGDITGLTATVLVNALYFNGEWSDKFDKKDTYKGLFHSSDGDISAVDFMKGTKEIKYTTAQNFTMASLDFGNGAYAARFILPNADKTFDDCVNEIKTSGWEYIISNFSQNGNATIKLPKFSLKMRLDMKPIYEKMGIKMAFDGNFADFSKMSPNSISMTGAFQSNYFEIDENGATAASASGIVNDIMANMLPSFTLDRPFMFALTEQSSGAILFIGKIENL